MGGSEGWVAELGEKVSALQFVSLVENFNCDELICQAELRQVWSTLGGREWGDWDLKEQPVVKRLLRKQRETTMYLDVVGRWLRRVKNVKRVMKRTHRKPRLVQKNPRLFWSLERVELLKGARDEGPHNLVLLLL